MLELKHLKQTRDNNCGQTCVAIITRLDPTYVEKRMNCFNKTATHDLGYALQDFGFTIPQMQLQRVSGWEAGFPKLCIVKMKWLNLEKGREMSHWIVRYGNVVYDPALDREMSWIAYYEYHRGNPQRMRPTSYLEVREWD